MDDDTYQDADTLSADDVSVDPPGSERESGVHYGFKDAKPVCLHFSFKFDECA